MDAAAIEEIFQAVGPVTIKKFFGGKGVYAHSVIIGCEFEGDLLLKADAETAPLFDAAGCVQWAYVHKSGKPVKMPYWSIPENAYDDPDEMAKWVRLALEAGLRAKK